MGRPTGEGQPGLLAAVLACVFTANRKLLVTSASLLVTSALLVVTRS